MGMTTKQIIRQLTNIEKMYKPVTPLVINEAKELALKYQQLQADYETRLNADMVAMLEEIQLELDEEIYDYNGADMDSEAYAVGSCKDVIQQKINALKGEGGE